MTKHKAKGRAAPSPEQQLQQAQRCYESGDVVEASRLCHQLLRDNPRDDRAWALWGYINDKTGNLSGAVDSFLRALECRPNHGIYYFIIGKLFIHLSNPKQAQAFLEKAVELQPHLAEPQFFLGKAHLSQHDFRRAVTHFRNALERAPDNLSYHEQYINCLENMNHLQEAKAALDTALDLDPDYINFSFIRAKLLRRDKQWNEAFQLFETFIAHYRSKTSLDGGDKQKLCLALTEKAKILEKQKDFDGAFTAFSEAQAYLAEIYNLTRQSITADAKRNILTTDEQWHFSGIMQKTREWFTNHTTQNWPMHSPLKGPCPVFLVGFPRSGTTLLGNILGSHANLVTLQEEDFIFNIFINLHTLDSKIPYPQALETLTPEHITLLQNHYMASAQKSLGDIDLDGKTLVDKMPSNIVNIAGIYRLFPEARIVVLLRDPRDVCLSCFVQPFTYNSLNQHFNTLRSTVSTYVAVMNTYLQLKPLLPSGTLMEVHYETLVGQLEPTLRGIMEHIGQPWDEGMRDYHKAKNNQYVATPSYEGVAQPVYNNAAGKWHSYAKHFAPFLDELSPLIAALGYE